MVLQRAPQTARIYGFEALQSDAEALLDCNLNGEYLELQAAKVVPTYGMKGSGDWEVLVPPQEGGTTCDITIQETGAHTQVRDEVSLKGVLFGDVWLCSGQSNMVFPMHSIFNGSAEIKNSAKYEDIRFTVISRVTSPQEEQDVKPMVAWSQPAEANNLGVMSAVCFLFARNVYDAMIERGERVPMGLIDSAWGGTRVEAWSNGEALSTCDVPEHIDNKNPQHSNSYLWNAMIAPLRKMTLTGFLWYQGEANAGWNKNLYNCTFPTMIDSWRQEFMQPDAPFGFVQLSTIAWGNDGLSYPQIRSHQTADYNTVPNPRMPNTFMAVAVDTYDKDNHIHPRFKQIVGERLALAGLSVGYGMDFPSQGPIVTNLEVEQGDVTLTYDQPFNYDDTELTGFFSCCGAPGVCRNQNHASTWPAIGKDKVTGDPGSQIINISPDKCEGEGESLSLAYLWRETPIRTPVWGAPIYADNDFRLPSPPWIWEDVL